MKIGVFGGCFNPPHKSHKQLSELLLENGYVDEIIFVPTGDFYPKRDLASFEDRVNMLKLMVRDHDKMSVLEIGGTRDCEFTYQLMDKLRDKYSDVQLYFVCGTDNLRELNSWKRYEYILSNYNVLVTRRNGDDVEKIVSGYSPYDGSITVANVEVGDLSSTKVRMALLNEEETVKEFLDESVYEYIDKNNLYRRMDDGI